MVSEIQENFPQVVATDGYRIKQILINLMSNAIKYTEKGFVKLEATFEPDWLTVAVIDTGVGIEPNLLSKLFKAYTKIERNREMNADGVGLGLTISKNLAQALGGDISAESVLGLGSKFTIVLPYKPAYNSSSRHNMYFQSGMLTSQITHPVGTQGHTYLGQLQGLGRHASGL